MKIDILQMRYFFIFLLLLPFCTRVSAQNMEQTMVNEICNKIANQNNLVVLSNRFKDISYSTDPITGNTELVYKNTIKKELVFDFQNTVRWSKLKYFK